MFPIEFIRECMHRVVTVSFKNGDLYSGILENCDNLANFVLTNVTVAGYRQNKDGQYEREERKLDRAMIRGSSVQCIALSGEIAEIVRSKRAIVQRQGNQNRNNSDNNHYEKQRNRPNNNNNVQDENQKNHYHSRGRGGYRGGYRGRGGYNNSNRERQMVYTPSQDDA